MYLSDLMVAALAEGGRECVIQTINLMTRLPTEWWNFRGCKNWLVLAHRTINTDPEKFFTQLEEYAKSTDWSNGKSFEEKLTDA